MGDWKNTGYPITRDKARATYLAWLMEVRPDSLLPAKELQEHHRVSFWDAIIVIVTI
jgi:predicted nucleic acid-binding protein